LTSSTVKQRLSQEEAQDEEHARELVITPARRSFPDVRELWGYRELLFFMVWRDVKVRYKQTAIGAAWAILQPVTTMILFSIIFGHLARLPSNGLPYPLFAYSALVPWTLFTYALTQSSNSLVSNQALVSKVYFPRIFIPIAAALAGLVDFVLSFTVLVGMMVYYGVTPTVAIVLLPLFLLLAVATALAIGLWFSTLSVRYRDVQYTVPFIVQFWLFATPVAYSSTLIPGTWRLIYGLNPMAGVVDGFRWALLGERANLGPMIGVSVGAVVVIAICSLLYFQRTESTFADVL
jgi:lipopolysaccharide transport system permease protein